MKKLIVLRGLPGSGKSFLAVNTLLKYKADNIDAVIRSTDDYWLDRSGNYNFDITKLGVAHLWNQKCVVEDMAMSYPVIIVDNTNTTPKEALPYVKAAKQYGYEIEVMEPDTYWRYNASELFRRNTHNVPMESIVRMLNRWVATPQFKKELCI